MRQGQFDGQARRAYRNEHACSGSDRNGHTYAEPYVDADPYGYDSPGC